MRKDNVIGVFAKDYINDPHLMDVRFEVTLRCNFGCSYCISHDLNIENPSYETSKRVIDFLIDMEDKNFYLNTIGGEPTVNPNLFNILEYFINNLSPERLKKSRINLSTNFSKPISYYNDLLDMMKSYDMSFNIFPSYHRGFIKLEEWIKRYEWSLENDLIKVGAFMVHSNKCINEFKSVQHIKKLKPRAISDKEYLLTDKEVQISRYDIFEKLYTIKKQNNNISVEEIKYPFDFSFKNFVCNCFKNCITIEHNGDINYCIDYQFNTKSKNNVFKCDKNFIYNHQNVICPFNKCECNFGVPKIDILHFKKIDIEDLCKKLH